LPQRLATDRPGHDTPSFSRKYNQNYLPPKIKSSPAARRRKNLRRDLIIT